MSTKQIGAIEWQDLTVGNATEVKDFYQQVVGWKTSGASMGDYDDYNVELPESGDTIAGICHAKGPNQDLPAQWLLYVRVESVARSADAVIKLGGKVITGPKPMGGDDYAVIQDPAGAVMALVSERTVV